MSVYNESESEIRDAIQSILSQDYSNLEFIIVNDNPENANISKILYTYDDDRIKIFNNEKNLGLALSLNNGIKQARGEYIARMDADDISAVDRISKEVFYLEQCGYDMVTTNRYYIDEKGDVIRKKASLPDKDRDIRALLKWGSFICHPSVLIKKEVVDNLNGYRNFKTAQDYDLWLRLLSNGYKIGVLNEYLLYYRVRENSITSTSGILRTLLVQYQKKLYRQRKKKSVDTYKESDVMDILERAKNIANDKTALKSYNQATKAIEQRKYVSFLLNIIKLSKWDSSFWGWGKDLGLYVMYRKIHRV